MAKAAKVWTGTQWDSLAIQAPDLSNYSTTTQMNTAIAASAGLTLVNSTSFTTQSSVSFNNVFSATYDNYVLLMDILTSANEQVRMRYRVSGADNTTSNYAFHTAFVSSASTAYAAIVSGATTSNLITSSEGTNSNHTINMTVFKPFLTDYTSFVGIHQGSGASSAAPIVGGAEQGQFLATTSFTGFTVFPNSGTITGKIRVYGVQNA